MTATTTEEADWKFSMKINGELFVAEISTIMIYWSFVDNLDTLFIMGTFTIKVDVLYTLYERIKLIR